MIVARVQNDQGRAFNVRLIREGERYGLKDALTHDSADPLVEWWDATYENDPRFTLGLGQFVARYYLSTLTERRDYGRGLDLCGYEPAWRVSASNVAEALAGVARALAGLGAAS